MRNWYEVNSPLIFLPYDVVPVAGLLSLLAPLDDQLVELVKL
jgi:hypothetical protein